MDRPSDGVWIGISGSPASTPRSGTVHGIARCRELGVDALEIAWVHRVTVTRPTALRIRRAAREHGVRLSVHAPYYVNLNSHDPARREASKERVFVAARAAGWVGARDVALHLAFYHDDPPATVLERVAEGLAQVRARLGSQASVTLRPELMGRRSQFGGLEEVLRLCQLVPGTAPCIDIAHLHARTGAYNTAREFEDLWASVAHALGAGALADVHVHLSGIAYGPAGEVRHLPLEEADLDYHTFLEVLHACGVRGLVVVESPTQEKDVQRLAAVWRAICGSP